MKNFISILTILCSFAIPNAMQSQTKDKPDSLGLPGDNLNLYVVLQVFQETATLEEFEKKINYESNKINNLDLNNDDKTDYIRVIDNKTGDSHAIVLQTNISDKETQDIAVIEVEKDKAGKVIIQIVGDEELYGKDYIVEPKENDPVANKSVASSEVEKNKIDNSSNDNSSDVNNNTKVYVTVNAWPVVTYMYAPAYVVYVSPWYWSYYPSYWHPWTPYYWNTYYWHHWRRHHHHYNGYYCRTGVYRAPAAHGYYGPRRVQSGTVKRNRADGVYHNIYKRETAEMNSGGGIKNPGRPNPGYTQPSPRQNKGNDAPIKGANNGVDVPRPKGPTKSNNNSNHSNPVKNQNQNYNTPRPKAPSTNPTPRTNSPTKGGGGGKRK